MGKAIGKVNVRAQVDTNGNWAASLNWTEGKTSPKPNGGTESHPVEKTMTLLRLGDPPCSPFYKTKCIKQLL